MVETQLDKLMDEYAMRKGTGPGRGLPRRAETAGLLYRQHVTYRFMPADGESEGLKLDRNMFWGIIDSVNVGGAYPDQEIQRCRLTAACFWPPLKYASLILW